MIGTTKIKVLILARLDEVIAKLEDLQPFFFREAFTIRLEELKELRVQLGKLETAGQIAELLNSEGLFYQLTQEHPEVSGFGKREQRPGQTWKVRIWHRTHWSKATIVLERLYYEGPGEPVGWLFRRVANQFGGEARIFLHIEFLERINEGGNKDV